MQKVGTTVRSFLLTLGASICKINVSQTTKLRLFKTVTHERREIETTLLGRYHLKKYQQMQVHEQA